MKKILIIAALAILTIACNNNQNKKTETKDIKPTELTTTGFSEKIADYRHPNDVWSYIGDKPAVIDFYATWCGPCRVMEPILQDIMGQYEGVVDVYRVDVDKESELARIFGIQSIPTFMFIPMRGQPNFIQGTMSQEDMESTINDFLLKDDVREYP